MNRPIRSWQDGPGRRGTSPWPVEPFPGAVVGAPYTLPVFGTGAPTYVDRNHRFMNDAGSNGYPAQPIPAYLNGLEFIMSGNDNRDNGSYLLAVTVNAPVRCYMLIDNRMGTGAGDAADRDNPPNFDATHMQWILNGRVGADDQWLQPFCQLHAP